MRDLLHARGTSFGRLRLEQRLERCRDDLMDPLRRHRSVSDIACARGFNSPAHFSRVFRERYGVPPASFRRRARAAQCPLAPSAPSPVCERTYCASKAARSPAAPGLRSSRDTSQIVPKATLIENSAGCL